MHQEEQGEADVPEGSKRCKRWWAPKDGRRCDAEHKLLEDFNKDAKSADGRRAVCKNCLAQDREVCPAPATAGAPCRPGRPQPQCMRPARHRKARSVKPL